MKALWVYLLILASGLLYLFAFAPWDQGYLAWITFLPLFIALDPRFGLLKDYSYKRIFLCGFGVSAIICLGGYYWMVYATQQYGGLPLFAAIALFLAFCLIGQLQIPIYFVLRARFKKHRLFATRPWLWILLSGFLYTSVESLYPKLFLDTAGHMFYRSPWIRQLADLGGPFLLTAIVIITNELWCETLARFKTPLSPIKKFAPALMGLLIIAATLFYGAFRFQQVRSAEALAANQPKLRVAMIQANIGDFLKIESERGMMGATQKVIGQYLELSAKAANAEAKPDAILWPETAYPGLFEKPMNRAELDMDVQMKSFASSYNGVMIFGGYDQDHTFTDYNSLIFFEGATKIKKVYHKAVLLMFGETLPFYEYFPQMKNWFPTMGFFGRGPGALAIETHNIAGDTFKLAPSICYEGLITSHSIDGALQGADALVNVTNDSWFGEHVEPYTHLALTTFRSIETRLPMFRATNTGFTTFIDSTGEIRSTTNLGRAEILTAEINQRLPLFSPYLEMSRIFGGNWFVRFCQLLLAVILLFSFTRSSKKA